MSPVYHVDMAMKGILFNKTVGKQRFIDRILSMDKFAIKWFSAYRLYRLYAILWRVCRKLHKIIIQIFLPLIVRPQSGSLELKRLGTDYGGWTVPVNVLNEDSICYCAGVGTDASFDFALLDLFGCSVFSLDPTPKAIAYMKSEQYDRNKLSFLPIGVLDKDVELPFYAPAKDIEVSCSIFDLHGRGQCFKARCYKLSSIMKQLGHDHIDLLKLDIEGSWRGIIPDIVNDGIKISVLCVEFDSPTKLTWVLSAIRMLKSIGFVLVFYEKENFTFVQESLISQPSGQ